MAFLDAIGEILGGFQGVAMQDKYGPDWRQQRAAKDFALQQQQAEEERAARQFEREQEEADITGLSEAALAPGGGEETLGTMLPASLSAEQRKARIARALGRSAQSKSSLAAQKASTDWMLKQLGGQQALTQIGARGDEAQELARIRAEIEAGRPLSPRDRAMLESAEKRATTAQAGVNERWGNMPVQVPTGTYDQYGNPEYTFQPRGAVTGQTFGKPNPTEQRARVEGEMGRASMETNLDTIQRQLDEVKKYSGSAAFTSPVDAYNARETYKATTKNLAIAANRVLGDTSGRYSDVDRQVAAQMLGVANDILLIADPELAQKRLDEARTTITAMGEVQQRLRPAAPRGRPPGPPAAPPSPAGGGTAVRSRQEAAALPVGAVFTLNGRRLRKTGPGQYEEVP